MVVAPPHQQPPPPPAPALHFLHPCPCRHSPAAVSQKVERIHQVLNWCGKHLRDTVVEVSIDGTEDKRNNNSPLTVRVHQTPSAEAQYGTGMMVWDTAVWMASALGRLLPESGWAGKRAVELGSGTGIVGLAAAALGAHVTLTDVDLLQPALRDNIVLNPNMQGDVTVDSLIWGSEGTQQFLDRHQQTWDIVIVCECIVPRLYPIEPLVEAIARLCGDGTVVLVGYEHRLYPYYDPRERFQDVMNAHGLLSTQAIRALAASTSVPWGPQGRRIRICTYGCMSETQNAGKRKMEVKKNHYTHTERKTGVHRADRVLYETLHSFRLIPPSPGWLASASGAEKYDCPLRHDCTQLQG